MTEKTKKRVKTACKIILGAAVVGGVSYVAYKRVPVFRNGVNKFFGKVSNFCGCKKFANTCEAPKFTTRPVHVDVNGKIKTR